MKLDSLWRRSEYLRWVLNCQPHHWHQNTCMISAPDKTWLMLLCFSGNRASILATVTYKVLLVCCSLVRPNKLNFSTGQYTVVYTLQCIIIVHNSTMQGQHIQLTFPTQASHDSQLGSLTVTLCCCTPSLKGWDTPAVTPQWRKQARSQRTIRHKSKQLNFTSLQNRSKY